jgi:NAD(P)-dependent dehydrogenase (short-subunit alcohol dehydrogenase family)
MVAAFCEGFTFIAEPDLTSAAPSGSRFKARVPNTASGGSASTRSRGISWLGGRHDRRPAGGAVGNLANGSGISQLITLWRTVMTTRERSALIIGASRGLGLRLVQQYRLRGWRVVATVRDAHALPSAFREKDERLEVAQLDVTKPAEIAALADRLAARRFDLLFVVAGVTNDPGETIGEVSTEEFVHVMTTNVLGPMRCIEALASLLVERGTLAAMSSGLASIADNTTGGWEVYRASKAALNMSLRSFAARSPGRRTILSVAPGWSRTDMGGPSAPLEPDESVRGVIETLDALEGTGKHAFVDYRGVRVEW